MRGTIIALLLLACVPAWTRSPARGADMGAAEAGYTSSGYPESPLAPPVEDPLPPEGEVCEHPFGGDAIVVKDFLDLINAPTPAFPPMVAFSSSADDEEDCDKCPNCGNKPCTCPRCSGCGEIGDDHDYAACGKHLICEGCPCIQCGACGEWADGPEYETLEDGTRVQIPFHRPKECGNGLVCEDCSCCKCTSHKYTGSSSFPGTPNAVATVTVSPKEHAPMKVGGSASFSATPTFNFTLDVPQYYVYVEMDEEASKTTYSWSPGGGTGAGTTIDCSSSGQKSATVTFTRTEVHKYRLELPCDKCGEIKPDGGEVSKTATATATDSGKVTAYGLTLEANPSSVGAGGVSSKPHQYDLTYQLTPADDSGVVFEFTLETKDKDNPDNPSTSPIRASKDKITETHTSGTRKGGGVTIKATDPGVNASADISFAHSFGKADAKVQDDGSVICTVSVSGPKADLDGHDLHLVFTKATVQVWDEEAEKLVEEIWDKNKGTLPSGGSDMTGVDSPAEILIARPGARILSAEFTVYDRTVFEYGDDD